MTQADIDRSMQQAFEHVQAQRFPQAEGIYRGLLGIFPDAAVLLGNIAGVLAMQGRFAEAVPFGERAMRLEPGNAAWRLNHGKTLHQLGRDAEAIGYLEQVLAGDPRQPVALLTMGECLSRQAREEDAVEYFRRFIAIAPNDPVGHAYLGQARRELGEFAEAQQDLLRAIQMMPANPQFHLAYGLGELLLGRPQVGWNEVEHRWDSAEFKGMKAVNTSPRWVGQEIAGKSIFLQPEQGMGDAIQFVRYAALIAARGGKVLAGCHPPLKQLLSTVPGVDRVLAVGEPMPATDYWVPTMSLPKIFGAAEGSYYAPPTYLRADPARVAAWAERLGATTDRRVGICWAGNPEHTRDRHRSTSLSDLLPLSQVKGVQLFSLQKGVDVEAARAGAPGLRFTDLAPELNDFTETAAALENLDLLITVDTAVAHLAGALGRPVWLMLSYVPDWRWMLNRADTPWYPTMRLLRQRVRGRWNDPVDEAAAALSDPAQVKRAEDLPLQGGGER